NRPNHSDRLNDREAKNLPTKTGVRAIVTQTPYNRRYPLNRKPLRIVREDEKQNLEHIAFRCAARSLDYARDDRERMKTKVFGQHDEATLRQIETCIEAGGERGVLCADGHKGYAQPIGGVVAYKDKISLSVVGFDIACGNLAVLTDAKRDQIAPKIKSIMDDVVQQISFGIGQKSKRRIDHEVFNDEAWRKCTITIIVPGARNMMARNSGLCAKERRQRFRASVDSSAAAWAMMR